MEDLDAMGYHYREEIGEAWTEEDRGRMWADLSDMEKLGYLIGVGAVTDLSMEHEVDEAGLRVDTTMTYKFHRKPTYTAIIHDLGD